MASYGNDANVGAGCTTAAPCRTFQAAHTAVDPNGEIVAFDAAGYGALTITKNVSVIGNPGFYAGIAASSGTAVTIATAGVTVILRNLNINNNGTATIGVSMANGSRLVIENCVISKFGTYGVNVSTAAEVRVADSSIRDSNIGLYVSNGATLSVSNSRFQGNGNSGVYVNGTPTATTTTAAVSDSMFSGNYIGFYACAGSGATTRASASRSTFVNGAWGYAQDPCGGTQTAVLSNNLITGNDQYGIANFQGTVQSLGNNTGGYNGGNTFGTVTVVPGF